MQAQRWAPLRRGFLALLAARGLVSTAPVLLAGMGRWSTRGPFRDDSTVAVNVLGSRLSRPDGEVKELRTKEDAGSADQTAEEVAEEAALLLATSSFTEEQRRAWEMFSAAVAETTPPPGESKSGPPPAEMLAALQAARKERDTFVAGLSSTQKEEAKQLLELEKRERKLRSKEEKANFRAQGSADIGPSQAARDTPSMAKKQKEVMTHAFRLFQQDRQKETGSNYVDSTEWKRLRALGGDSPVLRRYLELAGWDPSWPLPGPEGRLLRREGQQAALARYTRK
eukprot:TRINITY_DN85031_c0_g1_i1.p1 TRINITY_DN85031_c0_g1~~TRINITY_DN85031_c0_g1_i1.p1  ORF type:complete len:283 (-),score=72.00 TRINITY_DN85031_c0_g1_i1:10-858(-)